MLLAKDSASQDDTGSVPRCSQAGSNQSEMAAVGQHRPLFGGGKTTLRFLPKVILFESSPGQPGFSLYNQIGQRIQLKQLWLNPVESRKSAGMRPGFFCVSKIHSGILVACPSLKCGPVYSFGHV